MSLEDRALRSLRHQPQTAAVLAKRLGVEEAQMRAILAHMIWPNGKRLPYGPITCNKAGEYLVGDPRPLMEVPE